MTLTQSLLGGLVFILTGLEEVVAVYRTRAMMGTNPRRAALWCGTFATVILFSVVAVTKELWLAGPYIAGSAFGGYIAIRTAGRKPV